MSGLQTLKTGILKLREGFSALAQDSPDPTICLALTCTVFHLGFPLLFYIKCHRKMSKSGPQRGRSPIYIYMQSCMVRIAHAGRIACL